MYDVVLVLYMRGDNVYSTSQIRELIKEGRVDKFYNDRYWRKFSKSVIAEQHNECQICKFKGKVTRATILHHVKHLKQFPQFAYSRYYYDDTGEKHRQLIALCHDCHEAQHPERRWQERADKFVNEERW